MLCFCVRILPKRSHPDFTSDPIFCPPLTVDVKKHRQAAGHGPRPLEGESGRAPQTGGREDRPRDRVHRGDEHRDEPQRLVATKQMEAQNRIQIIQKRTYRHQKWHLWLPQRVWRAAVWVGFSRIQWVSSNICLLSWWKLSGCTTRGLTKNECW